MTASITALYSALAALLLIYLSFRVVGLRRRHQVGVGTAGHADLERAVRVQANFTEYVPLALLLMLLLESGGLPVWGLHLYGGALIAARLLHAFGLGQSSGATPGRVAGTAMTWLLLAAGALLLLAGDFL